MARMLIIVLDSIIYGYLYIFIYILLRSLCLSVWESLEKNEISNSFDQEVFFFRSCR